jgi:hypothetical protein
VGENYKENQSPSVQPPEIRLKNSLSRTTFSGYEDKRYLGSETGRKYSIRLENFQRVWLDVLRTYRKIAGNGPLMRFVSGTEQNYPFLTIFDQRAVSFDSCYSSSIRCVRSTPSVLPVNVCAFYRDCLRKIRRPSQQMHKQTNTR